MKKTKSILPLFQQNEEEAFRLLFDTHYDNLLLYAAQILGNPEVAKDVVQDCFVDFHVNKRFLSIHTGLEQYIFQSVRHGAINYLRNQQRRNNRHQNITPEENENDSTENYEWIETEALYTAINQLPDTRRKIFMMICLDGMKYQDVADKLNISINTVKTQMGRAFKTLREKLSNHPFVTILMLLLKK